MNIILFFIVLAVLILSHELGHFLAAKKNGIKVDEFGFGFPPRLFGIKKGETRYSFNLIPLGGFVKIHGEEGDDKLDTQSFASKPVYIRSLVISAGVFFNIILAWLLMSSGLFFGAAVSVSSTPEGALVKDEKVIILQVAKNSPADIGGLMAGDFIFGYGKIEEIKKYIDRNLGKEIEIKYRRNGEEKVAKMIPRANPPAGEGAIGIAMDKMGIVKLPFYLAFYEGGKAVYRMTVETALGIFNFIIRTIEGEAGLSSITGPIGIAGIVGGATKLGIAYFLNLIAFLSVNLAIINILPLPALDGGRLLFLLIEKIKGSPVNPRASAIVHSVGMALLLILMLTVTYKDILKLVS